MQRKHYPRSSKGWHPNPLEFKIEAVKRLEHRGKRPAFEVAEALGEPPVSCTIGAISTARRRELPTVATSPSKRKTFDNSLHRNGALRALRHALGARQPAPGLSHHTDRGCQYASEEYRTVLQQHHGVQSMSRRGNCWDNAVAESFFASFKKEHVRGKTVDSVNHAAASYNHTSTASTIRVGVTPTTTDSVHSTLNTITQNKTRRPAPLSLS